MNKETRIVTAALPFVNNLPHLGNIAGSHLPADIFARHCRRHGYTTYFIGGSDEHGTATELAAHKAGTTPQQICDEYHETHRKIYEWFGISYDRYSRTSNPHHKITAQDFLLRIHERGLIKVDKVRVANCRECGRGLADRLIRGKCPKCNSQNATGDQCEHCDATLEAHELISPRCVFCDKESVEFSEAQHLFIDLNPIAHRISDWLEQNTRINPRIRSEALGWISLGLKPRCITRRLNWGIQVPLSGFDDKVVYVWFENVIGYISILKELLGAEGDRLWKDPSTRVYHFFGKDNIVFHALYWPGELLGDGRYILPYDLIGFQHLTYEGQKFSKSKGIGIFCDEALRSGIPADYWRFFLTSCLPESKDSEFILSEFHSRIDSILIGVFGNLVHRTLSLIWKVTGGAVIPVTERDTTFEEEVSELERKTFESFEACRFREALESALGIARLGNRYLATKQPWSTGESHALTYALHCARVSARLLEPIIPESAAEVLRLVGDNYYPTSPTYRIAEPRLLFQKISPKGSR